MVLTAPCERVDRILIERFQDAGLRRVPFQQKVGAGLEPERFRELVAEGKMGHVGFPESIAMIAATFGWTLDRITDTTEPKLAKRALECGLGPIAAGQVAGIVQDGVGFRNGEKVIHLHMEAYIGARECYDAVHIHGSPPLTCRIEGGVPGDVATVSMTLNSIPRVLAAPPGLRTMSDLPLPAWWAGDGSGSG
jgi:4-hydroxy-tetrahydrodipicolinate reductase